MSLFNGVNDKFHVLEVLKLDQNETQKFYEKLKELEVEQKKDLQYVEARDLFPVLNLVQARKLKNVGMKVSASMLFLELCIKIIYKVGHLVNGL